MEAQENNSSFQKSSSRSSSSMENSWMPFLVYLFLLFEVFPLFLHLCFMKGTKALPFHFHLMIFFFWGFCEITMLLVFSESLGAYFDYLKWLYLSLLVRLRKWMPSFVFIFRWFCVYTIFFLSAIVWILCAISRPLITLSSFGWKEVDKTGSVFSSSKLQLFLELTDMKILPRKKIAIFMK